MTTAPETIAPDKLAPPPERKRRRIAFWLTLVCLPPAIFAAVSYGLDLIPDVGLAVFLRIAVLVVALMLVTPLIATILWFAGMAGRRVALIALTVVVANGLAGYTHWRNVPMPWDDVVRTPDYVTETAWNTLENWVQTPSSAPWNVLEPSFPRIEGIFALPQRSASRRQARSSNFEWYSNYFIRASGQRISGRFYVAHDSSVRDVHGFLRLPAEPYLTLQQSNETSLLELRFNATANLDSYDLNAWMTDSSERINIQDINLAADAALLTFPRIDIANIAELVVILRDPDNDRVLSFRFNQLETLSG
ncbi:MAG: hypothetical protein AAF267_10590 [Deinococcota bacterium]